MLPYMIRQSYRGEQSKRAKEEILCLCMLTGCAKQQSDNEINEMSETDDNIEWILNTLR